MENFRGNTPKDKPNPSCKHDMRRSGTLQRSLTQTQSIEFSGSPDPSRSGSPVGVAPEICRSLSPDEVSPHMSEIFPGAECSQELRGTLSRDDFSLAHYCLDRWGSEMPAVKTKGPNLQGPMRTYSYGEVRSAARAAANTLCAHGVQKGHKILVLQWNSWPCVVAYWGGHYIGAVPVMSIPTHVERKYLIKYTACRAVVAPCAILQNLRREIDDKTFVKLLLITDPPDTFDAAAELRDRPRAACEEETAFLDGEFDTTEAGEYATKLFDGTDRTEEFSAAALKEHKSVRRLDEALWYFTSGTTGKPKGCTHRQIDLAFAGETYGRTVMGCGKGKLSATDVLMAGPYAMGSNLVFPFCVGGTIFLDHFDKLSPGPPDKNRSPAERILLATKPDLFVSIPGSIEVLAKKLDAGDPELADALQNCEVITSAGAPLPPSTYLNFVSAARSAGLEGKCAVLDGIGTSELQHIFISNHVGDVQSGNGSVGKTCVGYEARLANASQTEDGSWQGELMVRTQLEDIFVKYSNDRAPKSADYDAATAEVMIQGGAGEASWYLTGDVAMVRKYESNWYFYLLGRTKDLASQIHEGEERGMGLEDFKNKRAADAVMCAAGLYDSRETVAKAVGSEGAEDVLVQGVYPAKVTTGGAEHCIFVCAISESYWPSEDREPKEGSLEAWAKYIKEATKGEVELLVFTPSSKIPRTPPPLLKPKAGEIKKALQAWLDRRGVRELRAEECLACSRQDPFDPRRA